MKFLSASQSRAARGLLNWSQPDLAERCGMHVQTISQFEQDMGSPTKRTLQKITETFEQNGIEFLENQGLRLSKSEVTRYEGQEGFVALMKDVLETAKTNKNREMCITNVDERNWEENLPISFAKTYRSEMAKIKNLRSRVILKQGDNFYTATDFTEYRSAPPEFFSEEASFYAYGDKLALITFKKEGVQAVVLDNKQFTDSYKVMFNAIWDHHTFVDKQVSKVS